MQNTAEVSVEDSQENLMEEDPKKVQGEEMNTEDTAQSSEELVIAKVEDLKDELPMDVDKTKDHNGKKVDKLEDEGRFM